jgi:hypothetical protein
MDFTLDSFASECRRILKEDPSPVGRGKVRELVQEVLKDEKFLATYLNDNSWAIYGQAIGETEMSDWEVLEPAAEDKPGKVRRGRVYSLKPGMAHIYNEGDVHSPKRVTTTGLIRIEGKDTRKMKRLSYKAV